MTTTAGTAPRYARPWVRPARAWRCVLCRCPARRFPRRACRRAQLRAGAHQHGVAPFLLGVLFSISVAAELTGLHPQTLRTYEREGLLDPARSPGGTRRYSTDDIDRLHQVMALTSDGLNLAGVRKVLELQEETRRLHAEIDRLKAAARKAGPQRNRPADEPGTSG